MGDCPTRYIFLSHLLKTCLKLFLWNCSWLACCFADFVGKNCPVQRKSYIDSIVEQIDFEGKIWNYSQLTTEDARWRDAKLTDLRRKFSCNFMVDQPCLHLALTTNQVWEAFQSQFMSMSYNPIQAAYPAYPYRKEGHCTARELASSAQVRGFCMVLSEDLANGVRMSTVCSHRGGH